MNDVIFPVLTALNKIRCLHMATMLGFIRKLVLFSPLIEPLQKALAW